MRKNEVMSISNRTKVLKRPNRYIGAIQLQDKDVFVFEDYSPYSKIKQETIRYSNGLIKIIEEAIDNSIDEAIRTNFAFANRIDIKLEKEMDGTYIIVRDNGRGIPIKPLLQENGEKSDKLMPEGAWCQLNTGSNFDDDDDNHQIGQNGEGVALTNIFSKIFIGRTADGSKSFTLTAKNNLETYDIKLGKSFSKFTEVRFLPDYERFGLSDFDENHKRILFFKINLLSMIYPQIEFYFNDKKVDNIQFKEFVSNLSKGVYEVNYNPDLEDTEDGSEDLQDNVENPQDIEKPTELSYEVFEYKNLKIGVLPNVYDDYKYIFSVNGINVYNGGKPLDWVVNNITKNIKEKFAKKYPNLNDGDIKNKIIFVVFFENMTKPRFEDQIKSLCSNTYNDFKNDIDIKTDEFKKIANKIVKNKDIIEPILETFKLKEEAKRRAELKKLERVKKEFTSVKYLPSTSEKNILAICEGASATGGLSSELGRDGFSYYELKGKPLNVFQTTHKKFIQNVELKTLYELIINEPHKLYLFATDSDNDGMAIRGLLLGFFYKYFPEILENKRVAFLQTPILIAKQKGKIKHTFYTFDEYNKFIEKGNYKSLEFKYLKGLGSYEDGELQEIIEKDSLKRMIDIVDWQQGDEETLSEWLDKDNVDIRKTYIMNNEFDIAKL